MIRKHFLAIAIPLSVVGALMASSTASASSKASPAGVVDNFLPGAAVTVITPSAPGSAGSAGSHLEIVLPDTDTPTGATTLQNEFRYNEVGWRARVAAGVIDTSTPIAKFTVRNSADKVPAKAGDAFHGGFLGSAPVVPDSTLDSISSTTALAQLNASIATLKTVMPTGSVTSASATAISSGAGANQYALEVDITVSSAGAVVGHYGDILEGLQTGLVGDPSSNLVEGLAIVVTAADGTPVVGSWQSSRSDGGTIQFADPSAQPSALQTTTTFANLTGGPSTMVGVTGAPSGKKSSAESGATLVAGGSNAVASQAHVAGGSNGVSSQAHVSSSPSSSSSSWLPAALAAAAIAVIAAGFVLRRHRRHDAHI